MSPVVRDINLFNIINIWKVFTTAVKFILSRVVLFLNKCILALMSKRLTNCWLPGTKINFCYWYLSRYLCINSNPCNKILPKALKHITVYVEVNTLNVFCHTVPMLYKISLSHKQWLYHRNWFRISFLLVIFISSGSRCHACKISLQNRFFVISKITFLKVCPNSK